MQTETLQSVVEIPNGAWEGPFQPDVQDRAIKALEDGSVVMLPGLAFHMSHQERELLDPRILGKNKNVAYTPWTGKLGGTICVDEEAETLRKLIARYSESAYKLMQTLFPHYKDTIKLARASLRPAEIEGRKTSWRKDDTRLHIDAFPTSPVYGERIVRVFCNVNPSGKPRVWRVGESFENVAKRFLPTVKPPFPGSASLMHLVRLTKKPRSRYDHYMLKLHDAMKMDNSYQAALGQVPLNIQPGTTWIAFADSVSHAVISGQHQFEQTFSLAVKAMHDERKSPLRILERLTGHAMV